MRLPDKTASASCPAGGAAVSRLCFTDVYIIVVIMPLIMGIDKVNPL